MEKAESNHLTASSTWVSNQQTRTVGTDWQVYCLELIKKPNLNQTTTKKNKIKTIKEPKKISASSGQQVCSWLETQLVTCTKVCELLPGRVYPWSCALEVRPGHWTATERSPLASPRSQALATLPVGSQELPHPGVCHCQLSLSSSQKGAAALSLHSSALVSHHESPVTQGGILKQLAVKIRNKSLPFSLLEPSFLSHEKDGF